MADATATDSERTRASALTASPRDVVRPLVRTRQYREFTDEPVPDDVLDAITDAGRWSGSSQNSQPWRFVVIRDRDAIRRLAEAGLPQTRSLRTAPVAIAIVLPDEDSRSLSLAYDDGRAAERMLVAASMLGVGAGIAWIRKDVRPVIAEILGLPGDRFVRTVLAVGHPTAAARAPKSAPGTARRPRDEAVFDDRWRGSEG